VSFLKPKISKKSKACCINIPCNIGGTVDIAFVNIPNNVSSRHSSTANQIECRLVTDTASKPAIMK